MGGRTFDPTLVVICIILVEVLAIGALLSNMPGYLSGDQSRVDITTTIISAIGLVAAAGAGIAAFATMYQQYVENRTQREVQTLHLLNEQYDKIFADIYVLRREAAGSCTKCDTPRPISEDAIRGIYTRYFTALATGVRYCQLGLVPRDDFVDWTGNLIARFAGERCIVRFDGEIQDSEIRRRWIAFDQRTFGPRAVLRTYMTAVWNAAESLAGERGADRDAKLTEAAKTIVRNLLKAK